VAAPPRFERELTDPESVVLPVTPGGTASQIRGSNPAPFPYRGNALPSELIRRMYELSGDIYEPSEGIEPSSAPYERAALPLS